MAVIKNSTMYFSVSIFQSVLSFCLLPVFTFYLGTTEFGLASLINSVAGLLGIFFIFGTQGVISRLYFEYKNDEEKMKKFLGTIFLSKLLWNIFLALLLIIAKNQLFPIIAKGVDFNPYLLIAIGIGFFNTLFVLYQTLQQTRQEGFKYSLLQIVYLIINNGITILLIVVFDMKAEGIVLGTLIADMLMTIFVFMRLRKEIIFTIEPSILKDAFGFSWPFLLQSLFAWGLASINKLILNGLISVEIVGVYSIGFIIAGIVNMASMALNRSYTPWFFSQMKKEDSSPKEIVRFSEFIILIYSIIALGLSLFGKDVVSLLLNDAYGEAWVVIPFLSFAYVFNGLYSFFVNIFNYGRNSIKLLPLYSISAVLINVVLNYLLIPSLGMVGSALATLISMLVLSFVTYLGSKRYINLGYNYLRMSSLIVLPFLMSLIVFVEFEWNQWVTLILKGIYALVCLITLYLINRKRFGSSLEKQRNNFKKYLGSIKNSYKNNKSN